MATRKRTSRAKPKATARPASGPRRGLCGKTRKLTKTECCGQWICDDEDTYVMFSYARNSCSRNHSHYTLCASHFNEEHEGAWQDCSECREAFEPEMYAYYGTNEYNFQKLANPPAFEPTRCARCQRVISLTEDTFVMTKGVYVCMTCSRRELPRPFPGR